MRKDSVVTLKGLTHFRRAAVSLDASLVVNIIRTPALDPSAVPAPPLSPPPLSPPPPWLDKAPGAAASINVISVDCDFDGTLKRSTHINARGAERVIEYNEEHQVCVKSV